MTRSEYAQCRFAGLFRVEENLEKNLRFSVKSVKVGRLHMFDGVHVLYVFRTIKTTVDLSIELVGKNLCRTLRIETGCLNGKIREKTVHM